MLVFKEVSALHNLFVLREREREISSLPIHIYMIPKPKWILRLELIKVGSEGLNLKLIDEDM